MPAGSRTKPSDRTRDPKDSVRPLRSSRHITKKSRPSVTAYVDHAAKRWLDPDGSDNGRAGLMVDVSADTGRVSTHRVIARRMRGAFTTYSSRGAAADAAGR